MPGFFSKLRYSLVRGDGLARYTKYAVGEILLISIGILIAMEIDNWNEQRIEQQEIHQYARALVDDLKADLEMIDPVFRQSKNQYERAGWLGDYVRGKELDELDSLLLYALTRRTGYRPFSWSRTAIDQLRASGALRQMQDRELVKKIAAYVALTYHLDEDYVSDVAAGKAAAASTAKVVDLNLDNVDEMYDILDVDFEDEGPPSLAAYLESFAEMDALEREPLLVDDIREVQVMVNAFVNLGRAMGARPRHEIPKLITMAEELIGLLDEEYPPLD
ncbi:MAG: DUF6090 family protein [Gammaproteobacteria bacterium]|nr:DUF6090 family protein [Gammaproteobacteria bacterium]